MESKDHISELPDHMIHLILSLIRSPKEVARTSILCKRWRGLWYSFSSLTFDQRTCRSHVYERTFLRHVDNYLKLYLEKNSELRKLSIHMISFDAEAIIYLDYWLGLVTQRNIGELDLNIDLGRISYVLPEHVLLTESISRLRLCSCNLSRFNNISLPRLQKLLLQKVKLNEQTIQNVISNCRLIDDFRLIQCSGLKELQIYNRIHLNRVEIHKCGQLRKVELECPNLHTFWFHGEKSTPCEVNLPGCKSLKKLTLRFHQAKDHFWAKGDFHDFPLLEALDLSTLAKLKQITISNPRLQKLALRGFKEMDIVSISAPKLRSFEFQGQKMPCIVIRPCYLRNVKLSFEPIDNSRQIRFEKQGYFSQLMDFIKEFDSEGDYVLVVRFEKNIVIYESLDQVLLPELSKLIIDIISAPVLFHLLDSLLTCHPRTLCMVFPSNREFPKLVYEKMKNRDGNSSCCEHVDSSNKCWRHLLKDIKFERFGDAKNSWTNAWLKWSKSTQTELPRHLTTLRLYWKPSNMLTPEKT